MVFCSPGSVEYEEPTPSPPITFTASPYNREKGRLGGVLRGLLSVHGDPTLKQVLQPPCVLDSHC